MHISSVNTVDGLDALRDDWRRLHAQDALGTTFMSWAWLRAWAEVTAYPWSVMVCRDAPGQPVFGFLPVSPRGSRAAHRVDHLRELHLMGDPAADYRGFLCDTERQNAVVAAFADHLSDDPSWDRMVFKDVLDPRLAAFTHRLRERDPRLMIHEHNGNACPLLVLPDSWDAYLSECLTQPSRKSLKKRLRIAETNDCRFTTSIDVGEKRHLDALMHLAGLSGKNSAEHLMRTRHVLESCMRESMAEVSVLWIGEQPAAAQGSFIDHHARSIGHYLTGYDPRFADLSPGRVMDAMCIRSAIERGFKAVDFLRGDEPYKHQLGARPRFTQHLAAARQGGMHSVRAMISRWRERLGG